MQLPVQRKMCEDDGCVRGTKSDLGAKIGISWPCESCHGTGYVLFVEVPEDKPQWEFSSGTATCGGVCHAYPHRGENHAFNCPFKPPVVGEEKPKCGKKCKRCEFSEMDDVALCDNKCGCHVMVKPPVENWEKEFDKGGKFEHIHCSILYDGKNECADRDCVTVVLVPFIRQVAASAKAECRE